MPTAAEMLSNTVLRLDRASGYLDQLNQALLQGESANADGSLRDYLRELTSLRMDLGSLSVTQEEARSRRLTSASKMRASRSAEYCRRYEALLWKRPLKYSEVTRDHFLARRSDITTVGRLRAYRDIAESTNVELGASYARGHNDVGNGFITQLSGADATLHWRPLRRAIYHSFAARSEFYWSDREQIPTTQRAFGFFGSAEYQLGRRWFTGGRYDWSERARNALQHDTSGSLVLTFRPASSIRSGLSFVEVITPRGRSRMNCCSNSCLLWERTKPIRFS